MAIHVALHHRTHYTYDREIAHAPHVVRLRPAPHCRTKILSYSQNSLILSGNTSRAFQFEKGSCCQLMKCSPPVIFCE